MEAAGPRRSLSGGRRGCLPAGTGGDAPRNGRSELLGKMRWVEEEAGDGTRVPGPQGGRLPGTWRHLTPFHSGRTAGRAQAAGLLGLRSAGKGLQRNGRPASRTVPGGVGSSLLETTAEAGQAVHPQTDQVCPIDRCTVLTGPGAAVCSLGSQVRRRDPSDEGARRRPRHPGPGRPVENHWTTGPRGGPAYPVPSNPEEDLGPSWELVRTE
ncbi:hypothetical protein NDU88_007107 [Pleurodeles waltl]|uniref:Uncharacterized protein n=1 Tax=Pleurodeles waltl TaxID=8319 RepID=A0AAV7SRS9_PLEWA|nr:hypothetical protein NDU88_007107 [Pleurodeles waltl]